MRSVQRRGARQTGASGTEKEAQIPSSFAASLDGSDDTSEGVRRPAATRTVAWTDALLHPFGFGRGEQHSGGISAGSSGTVDDSALIMTRDDRDHESLLVPLVPHSPSAATSARVRELKSSLVARGAAAKGGSPVRTDSPMGVEGGQHTRCIVPQSVLRVVQAVRRVLKPVVRPLPALSTCSRRTAVVSLAATVCFGASAAVVVVGPARVVAAVGVLAQQAWIAMPSQAAVQSRLHQGNLALADFRMNVLSPFVQFFVGAVALLSAMVTVDRLYHYYVTAYFKWIIRKDPLDDFPGTPLPTDMERYWKLYPKVVVTLPMFNEEHVCENIIDAACELKWPRSRLLVQVLDDSTCAVTREKIARRVDYWSEMGLQIYCRWRSNRQGYKAGAMLEGMQDIEDYQFCAIFDADFHPESDFLLKTVPYLIDNPVVGFVQARWTFANSGESLLTRMQELSLNYHVKCEQFARFSAGGFLNFNGTAGVWRRTCIIDAGNWNNRTTVEDMDLSLRAHLRGWRFLFLDHVECLNEVPATYEAYRKQQHRWSCGPMQLWRKATSTVWASNVTLCHKLYLTVFFFGTRMFATHVVSFFFYCILVPVCVLLPEVAIPMWALVYMPILITISTLVFTDGGWHWALHYVLFENAMSVVKTAAMVSGLLELSNAHEWVVTTKLGNWMKGGGAGGQIKPNTDLPKPKSPIKLYKRELGMGVFNLLVGLYGIFIVDNMEYSLCIIFQGLMFCAFGLNLMDDSLECHQCSSWAAPWSPLTHRIFTHGHQKKKEAVVSPAS